MTKLGRLVPSIWCATALWVGQASAQSFDDVFAIMTQDANPDSPGCRGCHIVPEPPTGLIWGDTEDEVLASLEDRDPNDCVDPMDPSTCAVRGVVAGGNTRPSILSVRLESGSMPRFGRPWTEDELQILWAWLPQYDDPQ